MTRASTRRASVDLGITYFDTAPSYNNGQSRPIKFGSSPSARRSVPRDQDGDRSRDGTLRSFEQSLKRLWTDHADLPQIDGVSDRDDLRRLGKAGRRRVGPAGAAGRRSSASWA